jgi:tetratricopeptide (TPR) repeat protein
MKDRFLRLRNNRLTVGAICLFLTAIVCIGFGQTVGHQFINYDDGMYVYQNPDVLRGLTRKGIIWSFTFASIGHWHPVTWWSHMLDCQLFGLWAGGHHMMNVLLHAGAAILLFLALREMTASLWRSGLVAALFSVHPLRVESVAWIAERKDVLSGVFFMLTLLAYARYVRRARRPFDYLLVAIFFALGLMSKGMLVTLPFVLLLLDYWPLARFSLQTSEIIRRLVAEKIPLFALSALSILATCLSPEKVAPALRESFSARLENVVVSYVIYLKQMFYPFGLTIPYFNPPNGFSVLGVSFALALLIGISIGTFVSWKTRPYLVVGWLWYLGMMLPMIGIVQISYYARADRYTYLPQIGLYIMIIWGVANLFARWPRRREVFAAAALVVFGTLLMRTRVQAAYWHDSETLWHHALDVDSNNFVAHTNLGLALNEKGRLDPAIAEYEKALQIQPGYAEAHNNLGNTLSRVGQLNEAIAHYQKALELVPDLPQVHNNLGTALAQNGQLAEAIEHFQKATEINPDMAGAHLNWGYALLQMGEPDQAVPHLLKALEIRPDFVEARQRLGDLFLQKGQLADAIAHYRKVLERRSDDAEAHLKLAIALNKSARWNEAIAHYRDAARLRPNDNLSRTKLAWLLATARDEKLRDGAEAVAMAKQSCDLTTDPDADQLDALAAA